MGSLDDSFIQSELPATAAAASTVNYNSLERHHSLRVKVNHNARLGSAGGGNSASMPLTPLTPSKFGSIRGSSDNVSRTESLRVAESDDEDSETAGESDTDTDDVIVDPPGAQADGAMPSALEGPRYQQEPPLPTPKLLISRQVCIFHFDTAPDTAPLSTAGSVQDNCDDDVRSRDMLHGASDERRESRRSVSPSLSETSSGYGSRPPRSAFTSQVSRRSLSPTASESSSRSGSSCQDNVMREHHQHSRRKHSDAGDSVSRDGHLQQHRVSVVPRSDNVRAVRPYVNVSVTTRRCSDGGGHRSAMSTPQLGRERNAPRDLDAAFRNMHLQQGRPATATAATPDAADGDTAGDIQIKRYPRYRRVNSSGESSHEGQRPSHGALRSAPQTPQVLHRLR